MAARLTVVVGPARCGKTEQLLGAYRAALRGGAGGALWIAPSLRAVENVRGRLLTADLPACFAPTIVTFDGFAEQVLEAVAFDVEEIRPIDSRHKRLLVERLIEEAHAADRLKHFAPIADTTGLVDLVAAFISELKRAEVWPDEFETACRRRGKPTRKDLELLDLYRRYQDLLVRHRLYDAEGRFWAARDLLQRGPLPPLDALRLVVVDGFSDLTRTQHEILNELVKRAEDSYVSLVIDDDSGRHDVFTKPRETLTKLKQNHPGLREVRIEPTSAGPAALRHLERKLFLNPRRVDKSQDAAVLQVLAAAGNLNEIEELARSIKRLLLHGDDGRAVRPDDVAVVFPSLGEAAPLVREVFARYGLPYALEAGRNLNESPSLTALVALVELDREDWPFRKLLAVTGGNFFRPEWPEWNRPGVNRAVEATIRNLQLPQGRAKWSERVDRRANSELRLVDPADPDADRNARHNERRAEALLARPVLRRLEAAFDALPQRATASEWSTALGSLAKELGFGDDVRSPAWSRFHEALRAADDLASLAAEPPPLLDRDELLKRMHDVIRTEQLPGDHDEAGRVRVLTARTARSLSVPYLFLAGLSEQSFSAGCRDRLYADHEYERLLGGLVPQASSADRYRDEMLLFYEAATRADRALHLSYAALDDKMQPLLPSPFLTELLDLFEAGAIRRREPEGRSPIPEPGALVSVAERRIRAVHQAAHDEPRELATVLGVGDAPAFNLAHGLRVVHERGRGESFGPFEGIVADDRIRRALAKRYDFDYPWSAGQLEEYGECPYRFFLHRVLKLHSPDEIVLEIDRPLRGIRLHNLMKELHERINAEAPGGCVPREFDDGRWPALVDDLIAAVGGGDEHPLAAAFDEIDRTLFRRWLDEYRTQHEGYEEHYKPLGGCAKPKHFEVSFGLPHPADDGLSTAEPWRFGAGDDRISIAGRIDRIDVGRVRLSTGVEQVVFGIVDYKTGKSDGYKPNAIVSIRKLQLTLYAVIAQELLFRNEQGVPWQFGYWFLGDGGFKTPLDLYEAAADELRPTPQWQALRDAVVSQVLSRARGVRRGEFPMFSLDEQCTSRCEFNTVCRVGQVRSLEKSWPPAK